MNSRVCEKNKTLTISCGDMKTRRNIFFLPDIRATRLQMLMAVLTPLTNTDFKMYRFVSNLLLYHGSLQETSKQEVLFIPPCGILGRKSQCHPIKKAHLIDFL